MTKPTALIILDGFGISKNIPYNAVAHAQIPHLSQWFSCYPHAALQAAGSFVGLPHNMQGNSEVGHMTIGSGQIIKQTLTRWLEEINNRSFYTNQTLVNACNTIKNNGNTVHIIGLLSDSGIHCHEKIIYACIDAIRQTGIKKIMIHVILDGRDTSPQSAYHYIKTLESHLKQANHAILGSLHGRFYAMDRDNNWQRIEKSYRVLTEHVHIPYEPWEHILEKNYAHNITDEFIQPAQLTDCEIRNGDGIIFCNIRPDRARQLTASFVQPHFSHFITKPLRLSFFITPVIYDKQLPTTHFFDHISVKNTLKDMLAACNKTIFSIAETEKYAHITYFFRGENDEPVSTETRILIPSMKVKSYDICPEMSAQLITNAVITSLKTNPHDFYLINYANADMVGHSGNFNATVQAIEFLDKQLKHLYDIIVQDMDGTLFITADHGKAEVMFDEITKQPRTAHTTNSVPFIMINKQSLHNAMALPLNQLADIAPFILHIMGLPVPEEMKRTNLYG